MSQKLSARQEECLRLTAFHTDREIAALLGISEATVKKHVHEACQRLGVNRRKAALARLSGPAPSRDRADPPAIPAAPHPFEAPVMAAPAPAVRFGYRAPPRNAVARVVIMAGLAVLLAATTTTVTAMVGDYHQVVGRLVPTATMAVAVASPSPLAR
jgi:DNA-binding CsgD family transcriptional regulator